jgi:hypothetical protein
VADPEVPATTPEAPSTEQPAEGQPQSEQTPTPDPREAELTRLRVESEAKSRAYNELQRKYQMQFDRNNASTALMTEMAESVKLLRESQNAIAKSTLGEEQAAQLDARITAAGQESQRRQAAASAMQFIEAQTRLFTESLQAAGVDTAQIAWPTDANSVTEWHERAKEQVLKAITISREKYIKAVEQASSKAKEAAKVEAEKIADKHLKEAGVGRVDTSKGSGSSVKDRINSLSPTSPEFQELIKQAKRGDLTKI